MKRPPLALDLLLSALAAVGALFALVAAFGRAELPDPLERRRGQTRAIAFGVGGSLLASALLFCRRDAGVNLREALVALSAFLTAPESVHLLAEAASRSIRISPRRRRSVRAKRRCRERPAPRYPA